MQGLTLFWKKNPALWVSLIFSCALLTAFGNFSAFIPLPFIFFFLSKHQKIFAIALFLTICFWTKYTYTIPSTSCEGQARFIISSYVPIKHRGWNYKGTLVSFTSNGQIVAKKLPCRIFSDTLYDANYEYTIDSTLKFKKGRGYVSLKTKNGWQKEKKRFSLAPHRFHLKKTIQEFLIKNIKDKKAASFLVSLITGDAQDDVQRYVFAKLGLAHLFAVSGFHFALFAFAFHFFLRIFFPKKVEAFILLFILSAFFLFIGCAPSVERAWFTALFTLFALLVEKEKKSLNTFGLALLCVLITNPFFIKDLGFILSFLATSGILLFFTTSDYFLQKLFPKKSYEEMKEKSFVAQLMYVMSIFFRKALALNIAVHIPLFPVLLATFHKFPFHSLIYNLFFPFLVSIALIGLLFATPFYFLFPPLGKFLFSCINIYTKLILQITELSPFPMKTWYVETLMPGFLPITLTSIFLFGILFKFYLEKKREMGEFEFMFY